MNTHDAWEQIHRIKDWGGYPSEHIIRFVARNYYKVADRRQIRILDFGCGTGAHTWYLAREGFETWAFDISETAIRKLNEKMRIEGLSAHTESIDVLDINYAEEFFDAVIDNLSIQSNCLTDIRQMYASVFRILKLGGKFITVVFDKETTGYGTGKEIESGTFEGATEGALQRSIRHFFDGIELDELLKQTGFEGVQIENNRFTDRGNIVSQLIAIGEKKHG